MSSLKFYLGLIRLVDNAAIELGLSELTYSDRLVLIALWDSADKANGEVKLTFEAFSETVNQNEVLVSRSQFFKSINQLLDKGVIKRIGGVRDASYVFLDDSLNGKPS